MTERHDVILAILGTSVVLGGLLLLLVGVAYASARGSRRRIRTRQANIAFQEAALVTALERQAELIRERDELREKLEDAETRCAILSALCNERHLLTRDVSQTLR